MGVPVLLGERTAVPEDVPPRELAVLKPIEVEERFPLTRVLEFSIM